MRVLFLDIDGVLNSVQSAIMYHRFRKRGDLPDHFRAYRENEFCPIAVSNLITLVEPFKDLKIVVSSTWRLGADLKKMRGWFSEIAPTISEKIFDSTPVFHEEPRGEEIIYWLRGTKHKVKKFAVIDDDSDMEAVWDDFFKTDNYLGLTYQDVKKIKEHLAYEGELDKGELL